jgi:hypothetical protein
MNGNSFHKSLTGKFLNFLFILPLFLGFRPLFLNYSPLDTLIFLGGMALIMGLIIYNNSIPYIIYDEFSLKILLSYREDREEHRFDSMLGYVLKGKRRLTLYSLDHKPLKIYLSPRDRERFVAILTQEGIMNSRG